MMKTRKFFLAKFQKNKLFALGVAICTCLLITPLLHLPAWGTPSSTKIQFVSPNWVAENAKDPNLRILDVRNAALEYVAGHLPGAVNIPDKAFRGPKEGLPVQYWDNQRLGEIFANSGVTNNSRVLVYSDGIDVLGTTMVAYLLERSGVKNIAVLDGGYKGYAAASQPVTKEFPKYKVGKFTVKYNPAVRVSLSEVRKLIGNKDITFIDARPPDLFQGKEKLWVRNGHIPGARNIPWTSFTDPENLHKFQSLDELKQILADKKITPANDIIVSCSTGQEATLQYVVLKYLLGYPKVRVYEGSWTEYSTQSDVPVATGPEQVS